MHGGPRFREPVVIDDEVRAEIEKLEALAPLHNAPALRAIEEAERALPEVPHVAVFDTAFHATIPDEAATYAVPQRWRDWGVRRYGFHGLSVQWCAERVHVPKLVVCHLGGGSSHAVLTDARRHDDGLQPARGRPDDDAVGLNRSGALLPLARARLRHTLTTSSTSNPA